jgi:UDP-N-acetylmuramate dehydrogenase
MTAASAPQVLSGSQFATYRIGGPLKEAYLPSTMDEAVSVIEKADRAGKPLTILGWGGNVVIATAGISGMTLITRKMDWMEQVDDLKFIYGAGTHLAKVAKEAERRSLTGAEFMIGIPGTVGGAIRMNAGAMGQETEGVIDKVWVYNRQTRRVEEWDVDQFEFSYRHSNVDPDVHVVLQAQFKFRPGDQATISKKMADNVHFRKTHHPVEPNGGSVFRNPSRENPVGVLIDSLGGKNWVEGGVRISPIHANFIINTGTGTSTDVLRLMLRMKEAIGKHYGLKVRPENYFIGDATPEEQELWHKLTFDIEEDIDLGP